MDSLPMQQDEKKQTYAGGEDKKSKDCFETHTELGGWRYRSENLIIRL